MNSLDILKKLKEIAPERYYMERSRTQILTTERPRKLSAWKVLVESLEAGSAMVLAGALLVLIFGGFSGIKPLNIASLNPTNLRAEADAIDMQIQLTNISYNDFARIIAAKKEPGTAVITRSAMSTTTLDASSTSISAVIEIVGIDDALKALSQ